MITAFGKEPDKIGSAITGARWSDGAPFDAMSQSERFHWLTTPRSTAVAAAASGDDRIGLLTELFALALPLVDGDVLPAAGTRPGDQDGQ